jgi:hypothetical protein
MTHYKPEHHIRERIREILVTDPRAGGQKIRKALLNSPEFPLDLDEKFITRQIRKIRAERSARQYAPDIKARISEMEERTEMVMRQMWQIIGSSSATNQEKIVAAKVIASADKDLLDAQMDAGVFDRKVGTLDVEENKRIILELPPEVKAPMLRAFKNYGLINPEPRTLPAPSPVSSE